MNTPALPRDGKTLKLAALIAMVLFVTLAVFALLLPRFQPEGEQRERSRRHQEPTRRSSLPPEVQRQFEEFMKEK